MLLVERELSSLTEIGYDDSRGGWRGAPFAILLSQQVETQFRSNNRQSVNYYSVTDEWATIQAQPYSWTLRRL